MPDEGLDASAVIDQLTKSRTDPDAQWKVIQDSFDVDQVATYFAVNTGLVAAAPMAGVTCALVAWGVVTDRRGERVVLLGVGGLLIPVFEVFAPGSIDLHVIRGLASRGWE